MLYGPKAVSEKTGIPPSTLRRYSVEHADQLSETARHTGGKRRYTDADILTLIQIRGKTPPGLVETTTQHQAILPVEVLQMFDSFNSQIAQLRADLEAQRIELEAAHKKLDEIEQRSQLPWWKRFRGK